MRLLRQPEQIVSWLSIRSVVSYVWQETSSKVENVKGISQRQWSRKESYVMKLKH